eukprot:GHVS01032476.1.p2 GENE.GHVS01032476.1~~GHVS01032476.1.p2  ORF type:complete len:104 (+),score=2.40 GHVS01032476.1:150-461(+)
MTTRTVGISEVKLQDPRQPKRLHRKTLASTTSSIDSSELCVPGPIGRQTPRDLWVLHRTWVSDGAESDVGSIALDAKLSGSLRSGVPHERHGFAQERGARCGD